MADFIDALPASVEVPAAEAPTVPKKSNIMKVKKVIATAATNGKKIVFAANKTKSGNPPYATMVTKAVMELKEKKGSSRQNIMKYLQGNYKVDVATSPLMMNKTLKKMTTDGRLVAGAQAGRSGAGCYKVSAEEKMRIKQVEKAAAKKLTAAAKKLAAAAKKPTAADNKKPVKKTTKKPASGLKKKKLVAGKKVVAKKSGTKQAEAKTMKKVSKASAWAKMKKGSAKPKKVAKKVTKKAKK